MLCRKCGAEIPDDASKCEFCGSPVTDVKKIYDKNDEIRQKQIDKNIEEKKVQLSEIQQRRDSKKAKQKRNKIVAIIAICLIAAGALGIGGYYVVQNTKSTTTVVVTPEPSTTPMPTHVASTSEPSEEDGENAEEETPTATSGWSATGETGTGSAPDSYSSGGTSSSASSGGASSSASKGTGSTSSSASSSGSSSASSSSSSSGSTSSSGTGSSNGGYTYNTSAHETGISTETVKTQIAVGGEVITINDNWYMTFTVGDTKYYAIVNKGASTDQVANKVYTLDAVPTADTYNGNTIYEITSMTKYDGGDYILPNSGTQLLTSADIKGLSKSDLALARNEIYARHGRVFKTEVYKNYFSSKSWYSENPTYNYDDEDSNLNEIEKKNVAFILKAE